MASGATVNIRRDVDVSRIIPLALSALYDGRSNRLNGGVSLSHWRLPPLRFLRLFVDLVTPLYVGQVLPLPVGKFSLFFFFFSRLTRFPQHASAADQDRGKRQRH